MKAKEFLRQYEYAMQRAEFCRIEYEKELEEIDAVRSTLDTDGLPHGNGISKKVEDKAIKLADKATKWKMACLDALEVKQTVYDLIWDIPKAEGKVLYYRYIDLLLWEDIADKMDYTLGGVYSIHRKALAIVENRLNREE